MDFYIILISMIEKLIIDQSYEYKIFLIFKFNYLKCDCTGTFGH